MAGSSKTVQFSAESTGSDFRMDLAVWVRWDVGHTLRHLKYERRIVEKRFRDLFSFIFWRGTRFLYLEIAYACVNTPKLRMKNWWKYDENSSSDARRGHLRTSKFPNFSKGESFPLWPPLSLRRRRWLSFVWDSRPPTSHFFHCLPIVGLWYCEFKLWCLHFRSSSS